MKMKVLHLTILGESGLHARPASMLVSEASKFQADITITIEKEERTINAKSIMSVLSLGGAKGDQVTVKINGDDEEDAALKSKACSMKFLHKHSFKLKLRK